MIKRLFKFGAVIFFFNSMLLSIESTYADYTNTLFPKFQIENLRKK
jgi:hypothetical protein